MLDTAIIDDQLSRARRLVTNTKTRRECQEERRANSSSQHALKPIHTVKNAMQDLSPVKRRPSTPPEWRPARYDHEHDIERVQSRAFPGGMTATCSPLSSTHIEVFETDFSVQTACCQSCCFAARRDDRPNVGQDEWVGIDKGTTSLSKVTRFV